MRWFILLFFLPVACLQAGETKSAPVAIRVHAEGSAKDGPTFVTPVTLIFPPKQTYIRKIPFMTEQSITAFYPFAASDGTIGCYFQLDNHGTKSLEQHTTEFRDTLVVALVNGRPACVMTVDKKITDGLLAIPHGFLPQEIAQLQAKYPTIGKEKEFKEQKKKAQALLKEHKKSQPKPTPTPKSQQ